MHLRACSHRAALTLAGVLLPLGLSAAPLAAQIFVGQSFTAPTVGSTLLQQVAAPAGFHFGSGGGPYTASIFAYSGSALIGPSLFDQVLGASFDGYTLTPNITLTPGTLYVLAVGSGGGGQTTQSIGDTFAGGEAITCLNPSNCFARVAPGQDIRGFSVQFAATAAPEPATLALFGTGLLAVGGIAARRRRDA